MNWNVHICIIRSRIMGIVSQLRLATALVSAPSSSSSSALYIAVLLIMVATGAHDVGGLQVGYYANSCPVAETIVTATVGAYHQCGDPFYAAGVLRMHFHDCWVRGCDASVLLAGPTSEQTGLPNANSLRGFPVIQAAKTQLEKLCPGIVSCADILAFAARDSVVISGGPYWPVAAGRFDGRVSNAAETLILPSPLFNVSQLTANFAAKNFSQIEMIALSGAHTIGQARCLSFTNRLYPTQDPTLNPALASWLKTQCPATGGNPNNPVNLDFATPLTFDNQYYQNLVQFDGLLTSDEVLFTDPSTASITEIGATNSPVWQAAFVEAIIKMGNLANTSFGEIRLDPLCQVVNP